MNINACMIFPQGEKRKRKGKEKDDRNKNIDDEDGDDEDVSGIHTYGLNCVIYPRNTENHSQATSND
jgi:hypothetical protein